MRKVESCFQQLEQLSLVLDSKAKNRPAHRKADTTGKTASMSLLKGVTLFRLDEINVRPTSVCFAQRIQLLSSE
jgi:hypothetical protein